jgi:hypothetical protein
MSTPDVLKRQLDALVGHLVEIGLANDQNFAIRRALGEGRSEITFAGAEHLALALKDSHYSEVYGALLAERAYNVLMPDGAMLQMTYLFDDDGLQRHRLAFLPSPSLAQFQNNPEIYLEDAIYADVVAKSIVPFPVRFDFDCRESVYIELHHAKSHMSLGQYQNCRIPVTAPLTPAHFIDFVLRHFYHTAFLEYASDLPKFNDAFPMSATDLERSIVHIAAPSR